MTTLDRVTTWARLTAMVICVLAIPTLLYMMTSRPADTFPQINTILLCVLIWLNLVKQPAV